MWDTEREARLSAAPGLFPRGALTIPILRQESGDHHTAIIKEKVNEMNGCVSHALTQQESGAARAG